MKKTKIVATLGPSSITSEILEEMIKEGVDVCRINFSHGTYEQYRNVIQLIRDINDKNNLNIAILSDLQGPKLRIGDVTEDGIKLKEGNEIIMTTEKCVGTIDKVYINYSLFPQDVHIGDKILLDDGKIVLEVLSTDNIQQVKAKIIQGGTLLSNKGVNLPNTHISLPSLTPKDIKDLEFAIENNVEWIGLSFVRSANDIIELKKRISDKGKQIKVIAKIEKQEAIKEIDKIIKVTDGIMVARGDLGVEVPMEDVPLLQKEIVRKCQQAAKPVIVATQMMESMINNISPTRAEVNDVANAVMDGADAVMLSGETSVGKHPVKVIQAIYKIIIKAETFGDIYYKNYLKTKIPERKISDSICESACILSEKVDAKAIVTMTFSGYTALKISSYRPKSDIFIFTSNQKILNVFNLIWGVRGFRYDKFVSTDETISDVKTFLKEKNFIKEKDLIINIASMPINEKGKSNMLKLSEV